MIVVRIGGLLVVFDVSLDGISPGMATFAVAVLLGKAACTAATRRTGIQGAVGGPVDIALQVSPISHLLPGTVVLVKEGFDPLTALRVRDLDLEKVLDVGLSRHSFGDGTSASTPSAGALATNGRKMVALLLSARAVRMLEVSRPCGQIPVRINRRRNRVLRAAYALACSRGPAVVEPLALVVGAPAKTRGFSAVAGPATGL